MVKSIAEKHGLRATFMPKPFADLTGNGCHAHVSLWKGRQEPVRRRQGRARACRASAYNFLGGIMQRAEALAAITNPTVNSYKRINAPRTLSGRDLVAEHRDLYRQQPHPHDPHPGQRPLRAPPGRRRRQSLSPAGRDLAAGLDGIAKGRSRQAARHRHVPEGHTVPKDAKKLPLNLLDALRLTEKSALLATGSATSSSTPISSSRCASGTTIRATSRRGSGRTRWTARGRRHRQGLTVDC